jgi:hypothetical protein
VTRKALPATISLTEALTDADEVVARLQAAQNLNHPNLVSIFKVGQVNLDNTLFVYAVMEHIEQSLSDVLQSQALSPEEGREVAEAMVGALTAIHQKGMSHGHVEAASVLATEETVKLRSDCLQMSAAGQADDVAGIGATLFHAFTQRKALSATDAQINRIPAPFAEIVRNSFARRWNLAQVANALKPSPPVTEPIRRACHRARTHWRQGPGEPPESKCQRRPPVPKYRPAAPRGCGSETAPRCHRRGRRAGGREADPFGALCWAGVAVLAIIGWLVWRPGSAPAASANARRLLRPGKLLPPPPEAGSAARPPRPLRSPRPLNQRTKAATPLDQPSAPGCSQWTLGLAGYRLYLPASTGCHGHGRPRSAANIRT